MGLSISRSPALCLVPGLGPGPWPRICITGPGSQFVFTGPGPQLVFTGPGPQFVVNGLGPQFVFTGPGPKFVFTGPGPKFYLPALVSPSPWLEYTNLAPTPQFVFLLALT